MDILWSQSVNVSKCMISTARVYWKFGNNIRRQISPGGLIDSKRREKDCLMKEPLQSEFQDKLIFFMSRSVRDTSWIDEGQSTERE